MRVIPLVPTRHELFVISRGWPIDPSCKERLRNSGVYLRPLAGASLFETTGEVMVSVFQSAGEPWLLGGSIPGRQREGEK